VNILGFINQIFSYNSIVQSSEWSTEINKSLLGAHQICSFATIHLLELCCVSASETRQFWIKSRGLGLEPLAAMMATDIGGQRAANNLIGGPARDKTIHRKARHACACWDGVSRLNTGQRLVGPQLDVCPNTASIS
jgi:hypothetical protein